MHELFGNFTRNFPLGNTDIKCELYYDESNNYRKVYIKNKKLNIPKDDNFVLAGVVINDSTTKITSAELRGQIGITNDVSEIKSKNIFHGEFCKILSSQRLNNFLHALDDNKYSIHLLHLNILYWVVIDIVESLLNLYVYDSYEERNLLQRYYTTVFHEIAKCDKLGFISLLSDFNFPDVTDRYKFIDTIKSFLEKNSAKVEYLTDSFPCVKMLIKMCNEYKGEKLEFIEDGKNGEVIDKFLTFYLHAPLLTLNSKHYFDEEQEIQLLLYEYTKLQKENIKNIYFVNSKDDIHIQMSDVIAGFFGKYFTFIDQMPLSALNVFLNQLDDKAQDTIKVIRKLIMASDDITIAFSQRIDNLYNCYKSDYFLNYFDRD